MHWVQLRNDYKTKKEEGGDTFVYIKLISYINQVLLTSTTFGSFVPNYGLYYENLIQFELWWWLLWFQSLEASNSAFHGARTKLVSKNMCVQNTSKFVLLSIEQSLQFPQGCFNSYDNINVVCANGFIIFAFPSNNTVIIRRSFYQSAAKYFIRPQITRTT